MGMILLLVGAVGGWHQDLWEVLRGSGAVYPALRIGFMGRNTPHHAGIGGPGYSGVTVDLCLEVLVTEYIM